MKSLIKKLVEIPGPSGKEKAIRDFIRSEIEASADSIQVDAMGNLIVKKGNKSPDGLRIMVSAHMDEIGLIATHVDEKGYVRFISLGQVSPETYAGQRVTFLNGTHGFVNHERRPGEEKISAFDQLFIDVGSISREECPVKTGDIAVFDRWFLDLGDRLVAKALDNRAGVAVLIELIRKLEKSPHEFYFVFSAQDEISNQGAATAAFGIEPDLGIVIDTTPAGDSPTRSSMNISLGKGPAIKVRDQGMFADPRVVRIMKDAAQKAEIATQLEIRPEGTTDARAIQRSKAGVPAGCISVPCRYNHTPSEMIAVQDIHETLEILLELLNKPIVLD